MINYELNLFNQEVSVIYRGEAYLVRDNGAIYRQRRPNKPKRKMVIVAILLVLLTYEYNEAKIIRNTVDLILYDKYFSFGEI